MIRTHAGLDEATLAEIEWKLTQKLTRLSESLAALEAMSTVALPKDSEEAASASAEIDRIESGEKRASEEILLVRQALERLVDGTYGVCLLCDRGIGARRLLVVPDAPLCMGCQTRAEKNRAL